MKRLARLLISFVLGGLVGAASVTALIGGQVDQLNNAKEALEEEISTLQGELEQIEKNISTRQELTINSIALEIKFQNVQLLPLEEETLKLNIEKQMKEILKNLLGKKIQGLNPFLIPLMLENRLIEAEGRHFRINVELIVLAEKLYLLLEAQPIPKDPQ